MRKQLKFVVERWVFFMVRRQTWQARRFEIFESARHFQIESGRPIRIQIESRCFAGPYSTVYSQPGRGVDDVCGASCYLCACSVRLSVCLSCVSYLVIVLWHCRLSFACCLASTHADHTLSTVDTASIRLSATMAFFVSVGLVVGAILCLSAR